ncbi:MFS transporter permease [Thermococcus chitonophagus]|uniref:MFS transporter permease n=2 Tax=Thermococcus chitonophagus TaxID=54262 RepID=A0A160VU04_9EURY|nr:MFS transporter [Thermococcus chitonophagus]ASJ15871.1 MFS transporter permease [Thermococcus chitonophagus]CUX77111.1 Permease, major facilitator superfamily [Thermococcus chitonophagus]
MAWFVQPFYFQSLGYSYEDLGVIFSVIFVTQAFALIFTGPFTAKFGYRRSIFLAVLFFMITRAIHVLFPIYPLLIFASVSFGIGMALEYPALMSLLSESVEEERRNYIFSLNWGLATVGGGLGTLFGGYLSSLLGYRITLAIASLFVPLQGMIMVLVTPVRERVEEDIHLECLILVKIAKLSIPIAVIGVAGGITMNYMGPWFRDYFGINVEKIGWIFTFFMIFTGLGTLLSPYLAEKFSNYWIILTFTLLSGFSTFLLPLDGLFLAIALHTLRMLLINMETPIWDSLYVSYFAENNRSTALALKSFAWTVSYGVSQYIGGWLFNKSLTWPFYVSGVIYMLSALLFVEIYKKRNQP